MVGEMSRTAATDLTGPRSGHALADWQREDHAVAWLTSVAVLVLALLAVLTLQI